MREQVAMESMCYTILARTHLTSFGEVSHGAVRVRSYCKFSRTDPSSLREIGKVTLAFLGAMVSAEANAVQRSVTTQYVMTTSRRAMYTSS